MTIDQIIASVNRVHKATFMVFSTLSYSGDRAFHCWIERNFEGDELKIKRSSDESIETAANEAWDAFRKLITTGYEPADLVPPMLTSHVRIDDEIPF